MCGAFWVNILVWCEVGAKLEIPKTALRLDLLEGLTGLSSCSTQNYNLLQWKETDLQQQKAHGWSPGETRYKLLGIPY